MPRALALLAVSLFLACASASSSTAKSAATAPSKGVLASIEGRSGNSMVGTARFVAADGGVTMHLVISAAPPGEHGVHIHEAGDCSDPKAMSAGGHFNPMGMHHGGPNAQVRHGGDLGNITVDASGNGTLDITVAGITPYGAEQGIVGRSIVVHEKADDMATDPSGNSGARIGCGVIQAEK